MPKLMPEEVLLELATNVLNFQHPHAEEDPRGDVAAYIISLLQQKRTCVDILAKLKKMRKDTFERGENRYMGSFDVFVDAIRRTRGTEDWVRFHTKKDEQVA